MSSRVDERMSNLEINHQLLKTECQMIVAYLCDICFRHIEICGENILVHETHLQSRNPFGKMDGIEV